MATWPGRANDKGALRVSVGGYSETMKIDLEKKIAIVTGAGRGIGREIATTLAAEGAHVVVVDLRQDLLDDIAAEWSANGWDGLQLMGDVRQKSECESVVAATVDRFGRVDILVNNAGIAKGAPVETLPEEVWDANFDVNLKGMFLMCQAVIPHMKHQKSGRIINSSSFAAIIPSIGSAAYATSKGGVHSLTRVLAGELGPYNVTANCFAPGMIPTEMNHFADAPEQRKTDLLNTLSLREWGSAKDVANLVCFLASDLARYVTGAMIDVSGGKYATQMPWMAYENLEEGR